MLYLPPVILLGLQYQYPSNCYQILILPHTSWLFGSSHWCSSLRLISFLIYVHLVQITLTLLLSHKQFKQRWVVAILKSSGQEAHILKWLADCSPKRQWKDRSNQYIWIKTKIHPTLQISGYHNSVAKFITRWRLKRSVLSWSPGVNTNSGIHC